uniref:Uncharacterized protein n=1 Tax=Kalanchoe fedtschenkoi TaxID=63787 RepID=A0A7N0R9D8_KALFE
MDRKLKPEGIVELEASLAKLSINTSAGKQPLLESISQPTLLVYCRIFARSDFVCWIQTVGFCRPSLECNHTE